MTVAAISKSVGLMLPVSPEEKNIYNQVHSIHREPRYLKLSPPNIFIFQKMDTANKKRKITKKETQGGTTTSFLGTDYVEGKKSCSCCSRDNKVSVGLLYFFFRLCEPVVPMM